MRLENKLAVITAAASGMGRAGVELFMREGAQVVAVDLNAEALDDLAEAAQSWGGTLKTVVADLCTEDGARDSIHEAAGKLGGIDILWAHAGMPGPGPIEGLDMPYYHRAMSLNVTSAILGAAEAVPYMRRRGAGSIVFTSSISGLVGSMFSPIYSMAKFGIVGLGKSLAQSFAADGIRVNVVCPGLADTPMKSGFTGRGGDAAQAAENEKRLLTSVPMGRLARPEEVAHAALWLASDDASFITGVALPVDGGYTCR